MKKHLLLVFIGVVIAASVRSQFFTGLRGSPYGGVTNIDFNPAIADNRFLFDINLIGIAANANNNYIGIDRRAIFHPSVLGGKNFQAQYLHERVNGRNKNAYIGAQITGPLSFLFSFGGKKNRYKNAIGFSYHANFISNADNVSQILARSAYYGLGYGANTVTHFLGKSLDNPNLTLKAAIWNDYGITYSRIVIEKPEHILKVGGTIKLLQPLEGAYLYAPRLNYKWSEYNVLNIYNTQVNYAYSQGLITSQGYSAKTVLRSATSYLNDAFSFKNGTPTAAVDLGVIYEWRPDKDYEKMDCHCNPLIEKKPYKVAAGFSVMDIGALRFKRGEYSGDFYPNIRNWDVNKSQFSGGLQSFDDTVRIRFQKQSGKNQFTIWLPTRFNLFIDYNIMKDFSMVFSMVISPNLAPSRNMVHEITIFTVTPKYEQRWFGVYVPLSFDIFGNVSLGATFRVGPLILGSQDLLGLFIKKYIYNTDIHVALKISVPAIKRCPKGDIRFNKQL